MGDLMLEGSEGPLRVPSTLDTCEVRPERAQQADGAAAAAAGRHATGSAEGSIARTMLPVPDSKHLLLNFQFLKGEAPAEQLNKYLVTDFHPGNTHYGNYYMLETAHDWIQWLFPTLVPSQYNQQHRALDTREARLIADDAVCQKNLVLNYQCFLNFIGFTLTDATTGALRRHANARARLRNLDTEHHNHSRISRVLACLGSCGLEHLQQALVEALIDEAYKRRTLSTLRDSISRYFIPVIVANTVRTRLHLRVDQLRNPDVELVEGSSDEEMVVSSVAETAQPPDEPQETEGIFPNSAWTGGASSPYADEAAAAGPARASLSRKRRRGSDEGDAEAGAGRAPAKRAKGAAAAVVQVAEAELPAAGSPRVSSAVAATAGTTTTSTARTIHLTRPAGWKKRQWRNYRRSHWDRAP